jgi:hypothetical protein
MTEDLAGTSDVLFAEYKTLYGIELEKKFSELNDSSAPPEKEAAKYEATSGADDDDRNVTV